MLKIFSFFKSLFLNKSCPLRVKAGLLPDKPDERDYRKTIPVKVGVPTKHFSLRKYIPAGILNQRDTGACSGYAAAQAMNILINRMLELSNKKEAIKFINLSPTWLYYYARYYDGSGYQNDSGATLRSVVKALKDPGAIHISAMDQNYSVTKQPPENTQNLPKFSITEYARIFKDSTVIETMQRTLDTEHLPIICGVFLYKESIENSYYNNGIIKYDKVDNDTSIGGHALCIIGYRLIDNNLYFECVNSWGSLYGDNGFCYIPADIFKDNKYSMDIWTFDKKYF